MAMLLTDAELHGTEQKIRELREHLFLAQGNWVLEGRTPEEIQRLKDPLESFLQEMIEEACLYRQLKNSDAPVPEVSQEQYGRLVVYCRIRSGLTQEQFAEKRGVSLEQVQRDERNEYYGLDDRSKLHLIESLGYRLKWTPRYTIQKQ